MGRGNLLPDFWRTALPVDPHPVWHALQQHVLKSLPEYMVIVSLMAIATCVSMPRPEVIATLIMSPATAWIKFKEFGSILYKWAYESIQAFLATRHPPTTPTVVTTAPVVITPSAPANTPKENP